MKLRLEIVLSGCHYLNHQRLTIYIHVFNITVFWPPNY